jgi:hypothetical protein
MRRLGLEPQVKVVTDSFLVVPFLVAGSRRIAFLQERLARRLAPVTPIRVLPSPIDIGGVALRLWWAPGADRCTGPPVVPPPGERRCAAHHPVGAHPTVRHADELLITAGSYAAVERGSAGDVEASPAAPPRCVRRRISRRR